MFPIVKCSFNLIGYCVKYVGQKQIDYSKYLFLYLNVHFKKTSKLFVSLSQTFRTLEIKLNFICPVLVSIGNYSKGRD